MKTGTSMKAGVIGLFAMTVILCSCQQNDIERIEKQYNKWGWREVKFPSRPVFTVQMKDTVEFPFMDKFVTNEP